MKNLLFITILLCLTSTSWSQIKIFGTVKNEKGKLLKGVHVFERFQEIGVPTNENGAYEIEVKEDSIQLEFSHIGYVKKIVIIAKKKLQKRMLLEVVLKQRTELLDQVEVTSSPVKTVINEDNLLIKDFEFYGEDLILLLKSPSKGYFLERKHELESKGIRFPLHFKPKGIEYDCFGNIQVLAKDSAYQIAFLEEEIKIVEQFELNQYEEIIRPCVLENDSFYVFRSIGEHGQSINYTLFPKDTTKEKQRIQILDLVAFKVAANYYLEIIALYNKIVPFYRNIISNGIWDGDVKDLNESKELNRLIGFYEHVLSKPIYSPIFSLSGNWMIFDHTNGFIRKANQPRNLPKINYHDSPKWVQLVLKDKWTNEFVTFFKKNGLFTAHYIDIKTGKLKNGILLEESAFPENLKLKDGYVYYLHKSLSAFYGNSLLKQKIKLN